MDETAKITDLIWHVHSRVLLSLYIWEVDDDGQRGEAEKKKDEDGSMSDTSMICRFQLRLTDQ